MFECRLIVSLCLCFMRCRRAIWAAIITKSVVIIGCLAIWFCFASVRAIVEGADSQQSWLPPILKSARGHSQWIICIQPIVVLSLLLYACEPIRRKLCSSETLFWGGNNSLRTAMHLTTLSKAGAQNQAMSESSDETAEEHRHCSLVNRYKVRVFEFPPITLLRLAQPFSAMLLLSEYKHSYKGVNISEAATLPSPATA